MEGVHHRPVAEHKGERLGLIALGEIDAEPRGGLEDAALQIGVDAIAAVENPGDGSNADMGRRSDLAKAELSLAKRDIFLLHWGTLPRFRENRHNLTVSRPGFQFPGCLS